MDQHLLKSDSLILFFSTCVNILWAKLVFLDKVLVLVLPSSHFKITFINDLCSISGKVFNIIEQASKELRVIKEQQKISKLSPSFSSSLLLCKKSLTEVNIHFLLSLIIRVLGWSSVWQDLLLCIVWTLNIQQELLWNCFSDGTGCLSVFFMTRLFEVLVGFSKWSLERKIRAAVDSSWHPPSPQLHLCIVNNSPKLEFCFFSIFSLVLYLTLPVLICHNGISFFVLRSVMQQIKSSGEDKRSSW